MFVLVVLFKVVFCIIGLLFNVFWAFAIVSQKRISHLPAIKISFYLGVELLIVSGIVYSSGKVKTNLLAEPSSFLGACIFSGLVICVCQLLTISALNLSAHSGKLTMTMFLFPVSSYLISYFRYN